MKRIHLLHGIVASPGDVQAERRSLDRVADEINRTLGPERGLRLELNRWETDAYPGFHPKGPQGLIDEVLRIDTCDLLIGIFWKRFGTPVSDAESGTEHEFEIAYRRWKQGGRPHIMVYFCQRRHTPRTEEERLQFERVAAFQRRFPAEGMWWPYRTAREFEGLVRRHLTLWLRDRALGPREAPAARQADPGISHVSVLERGTVRGVSGDVNIHVGNAITIRKDEDA